MLTLTRKINKGELLYSWYAGIPENPREREYPSIVKLLLQKGADPNAKDKHGLTPLQHAASDGLTTTVRILLDGGARPQNNHGLGRAVIYRGDGTVYY